MSAIHPGVDRLSLADGTRIDALVDVDKREVSLRVLSDPEILRWEMERIFSRAWVALAHESEIPEPGDFVTRDLGLDPVIVVRERADNIKVLLNVCQHRGMRVCRVDSGNIQKFRCIYHGWVYDRDGAFVGAPVRGEQMWGDVCEKSELGLRVARVEIFGGMIFATWAEDGPSLDEYLGDAKWYLRLLMERTDAGLEVLGPPQRFLIRANWKLAGEQFAGDGYHTLTLHSWQIERGILGTGKSMDRAVENVPAMYGVDVGTREGHGLRCIPLETTFAAAAGRSTAGLSVMDKLRMMPPAGLTQEMVENLPTRFSEQELKLLATTPPMVGGLFPNSGYLFVPYPQADGSMAANLSWHAFTPRGVDEFEFTAWIFAERGAPPELKRKILEESVRQLGMSGMVNQDDSYTWPTIQRSALGAMGRRQTLKYQALLGENKPTDWPGGGFVYDGFSKDDNQWLWWLRWLEYVMGQAK